MRFSSRQIVTMVVAFCAATVLTPVAVGAATGSLVNIADPFSAANKARVNATGQLWTNEVDPITKTKARVSAGGKRLVGDGSGAMTVDGAVSATAPAKPWNQINDIQVTSSTSRAVLYAGLGPVKLALTTFTVAAEGPSAGTVRLFAIVYVSNSNLGDCLNLTGASFGAAERFVLTVPVGQTVSVSYPTPLVLSAYAGAGRRYCVDVEGSGPTSFVAHLSASGFLT